MSDVYSDLNIKNGAKIVLGESGVSIDSSGCVVLDSGCTYGLSDVATRCYVDEEISKICTDGGVCGVYLPATTDDSGNYYIGGGNVRITDEISFVKDVSCSTDDITEYTVSGKLIAGGDSVELVSGCIVIIDAPGGACIKSNKCVMVQSGCSLFNFPNKGNGTYTLATTEDITGLCDANYLKLCCSTIQMVSGLVCFSCGINVNSITVGQPISLANNNCFAFYSGATFQLPNKQQCGIYTLATTEDISGSGCCYPTCYPLYSECSKLVSVFCYESSYNRAALRTCGTGIYINTEQAGDIHIDSYKNVIINAGCSIFFSNDTSAFCMFVPSHLPYMEDTIESTIVTSPGYTESGCGLQICVLTLCQYQNMSEHGMTTLYFITPES